MALMRVSPFYGIVKAFDELAKAGSWVSEHVFGHKLDTSGIDEAADDLLAKSKQLWTAAGKDASDVFSGKTAAGVFEYFDGIKSKADQTSREAVKLHEALAKATGIGDAEDGAGKSKIDKGRRIARRTAKAG